MHLSCKRFFNLPIMILMMNTIQAEDKMTKLSVFLKEMENNCVHLACKTLNSFSVNIKGVDSSTKILHIHFLKLVNIHII